MLPQLKGTSLLALSTLSAMSVHAQSSRPAEATHAGSRLLGVQDIRTWKSIRSPAVSNDGTWFAYRLTPNEGDVEVVVQRTSGATADARRFPGGAAPAASYGGGSVTFSDDSRWLAYTIAPAGADAAKLQNEHTSLQKGVGLVNLATGENVEFPNVASFSFSGGRPEWFAMYRYPEEKTGGAALVLRDLATGKDITVQNVSDFAFDHAGDWLAWSAGAATPTGKDGGVRIRSMASGTITAIDTGRMVYSRLTWSDTGAALAFIRGDMNPARRSMTVSVAGYTGFATGRPVQTVDLSADSPGFPNGRAISPSGAIRWTADLRGIYFGLQSVDASPAGRVQLGARSGGAHREPPDLVIWHWRDTLLQSQQMMMAQYARYASDLALYHIPNGKIVQIADDSLRTVTPVPGDRWAIGEDNRRHELMASLDGRIFKDIYVIDLHTGARRLVVRDCLTYLDFQYKNGVCGIPSPDGTHMLYYDGGKYYTYDMASGQRYEISKGVPTSFVNAEDDYNRDKPAVPPVGWSSDGAYVLLSDGWDIWKLPRHGGAAQNLTVNGRKDGIRYTYLALDRTSKGIDLGTPLYVAMYGEWIKKAGIGRIDNGRPSVTRLVWDDAKFGRQLMKAHDADVFLYTRETARDFPDYYATDQSFRTPRRITNANPQQSEYAWTSGARLVDYTGINGKKLQAALILPANYEPGKRYPTVVYIYSRFSSYLHNYDMPSLKDGQFGVSDYTNHGYAVLMPDIAFEVNDPAMSAVRCVVPAVRAAIASGIVDSARIGLFGHSWGGYETSFLITQTNLFKGAVADAPLVDPVFAYGSVFKVFGITVSSFFESNEGRFSGGPWGKTRDAYLRNSPVLHADRVNTPLLIMSGESDLQADPEESMEYFNMLRRLRKPVVMLRYNGEGHSLGKPNNQEDYYRRLHQFFDHYLKGGPAPRWLADGIPFRDLHDYLNGEQR